MTSVYYGSVSKALWCPKYDEIVLLRIYPPLFKPCITVYSGTVGIMMQQFMTFLSGPHGNKYVPLKRKPAHSKH